MTQYEVRRFLSQHGIPANRNDRSKKGDRKLFTAKFDLDTTGYDLNDRQAPGPPAAPVRDAPFRIGWEPGTGGELSEAHLSRALARYTTPLTDGQLIAIELLVQQFPPVEKSEDEC